VVEPQTYPALRRDDFAEFGPQNSSVRFWRESKAVHGVITKGASRRSNFVKSMWPSDENLGGSLFSLAERIGSMYLGVV
jgi:hypothetical protein